MFEWLETLPVWIQLIILILALVGIDFFICDIRCKIRKKYFDKYE